VPAKHRDFEKGGGSLDLDRSWILVAWISRGALCSLPFPLSDSQ
jgi:hypothetical protein